MVWIAQPSGCGGEVPDFPQLKIFFYSTVFSPSVGGIESMAELLCREFTALGHDVVLATLTPGDGEFPFEVRRGCTAIELQRLASWCDVHLQANVSLKAAWLRAIAPLKTFYRHGNVYQRDDGSKGVVEHLKTALARVTPSVANSTYTAEKTGAKFVVLNAYDDATFGPAPDWGDKDRDLVFLGRLVSQKGCDTLIEALGRLATRGHRPCLTVIGEGPDRAGLDRQVKAVGVAEQVRFAGALKGYTLAKQLERHKVLVVPSRYEEPFGIVALEGLACGCLPIVSRRGGLVDAIGGHGFSFPNGDASALEERLDEVLSDINAARARLDGVETHLARCRSRAVAAQYIAIFERYLGGSL